MIFPVLAVVVLTIAAISTLLMLGTALTLTAIGFAMERWLP